MKQKITFFKVLLTLVLLCGVGNAWGASRTIIVDAAPLTSTTTTQEKEFEFGGVTFVFSDGAKQQKSNSATYAFTDEPAILIGKSGKYIYNKTAIPGTITKFEIYSNYGASSSVTVGVNFSSNVISSYNANASNTYAAKLGQTNVVYDCSSNLPNNAKYFWFQVTNSNNAQVQFRITYDEPVDYTLTWNDNGNTTTTQCTNGELTLPRNPIAPEGYAFMGWTVNRLVKADGRGIVYAKNGDGIDRDTEFYAVYAKTSTDSEVALVKMNKGDKFADGDRIVIVAHNTQTAMYQQTVSSSYVNKYTFDGNIMSIVGDDKNWLTVTSNEDGYILGDATNGYIYSSSNNLYCGSTQQTWTLKDLDDGTFKLQSDSRYLSYRSDLSNKYWRMGGASLGTSGETVLDIYKITNSTVYLDFMTNFANITSAGWATACIPFNATVSDNVTAYYVISITDGVVGMSPASVIPEGQGVLLKSNDEKATIATFASSSEQADNVGVNMLIGSLAGATFSDANFVYYRLANNEGNVGFYKQHEDGSAECAAGKAVLAVPVTGAPSFFTFDDATAINAISNVKTSSVRYNLNGQAVGEDYKGIVIVNGKKMFNK